MSISTEMLFNLVKEDLIFSGAPLLLVVVFKLFLDFKQVKENNRLVNQAEKEAFLFNFKGNVEPDTGELEQVQEALKIEVEEVKQIIHDSKSAIEMGRLFNLYNKQIEKYQQETRSRASWSFIFAIFSMFLGMSFIFWGGSEILAGSGTDKVIAGSAIATIGGGISAYITKTFLDVHKLSITQLNKYFKQPVINDNILMAQRLADASGDDGVRKESYQKIVLSICEQISVNSKNSKE